MREGCGEDGWVEQLIRFRESRRGQTKRNGIGGETVMEGGKVERIRLMIGCDIRLMGRETRLIDLKEGTRLKEKKKAER